MNYNIYTSGNFDKELKKLAKKYPSIKADFKALTDSLKENPKQGEPLGKDCYKIRVAITSKGKGKSGGARMITFVRVVKNTVFLMDIYDKSEQANISAKELQMLIDILSEE